MTGEPVSQLQQLAWLSMQQVLYLFFSWVCLVENWKSIARPLQGTRKGDGK